MNVLAIDTAGPVIGVASVAGSRSGVRLERATRGTETLLPRFIDEVLAEVGLRLDALDGVAVAAGPGAFTGLRVGVATAAGLALALGVPVWAAPSALPRAVHAGFGGELVVWLDARKGRVYTSRWSDDRWVSGPQDLDPGLALEGLSSGFRATGEGAIVYRDAVEQRGGVVVPNADDPGVVALATLAVDAFARGEGVDPVHVVPHYVREADATPPRR